MIFLFWVTLGLRVVTNLLATRKWRSIRSPSVSGGARSVWWRVTVSGFLVAAFRRPRHENFLGYEPRVEEPEGCSVIFRRTECGWR